MNYLDRLYITSGKLSNLMNIGPFNRDKMQKINELRNSKGMY